MQDFSTISVCLSSDERYIWHLVETLWSIRKVSSERKTDVYVLLDCVTDKSFHGIASEIVRLSTKTMTVVPINVNRAAKIDKRKISVTSAITFASYARLFLTEIFPKIDKMLWLDCDLLVMKPLDEFWDVDVSGKYVAAVDDFTMENNIRIELEECKVSRYFNAGVALFNLKKIREDGIDNLCKSVMYGTKPRFQDQTVVNTCFKEKVVWLSPRFNLHYTSWSNPAFARWAMDKFGEEYHCESEDPTIVHFTGIGTKPWQQPTPFYLDEYTSNSSEARSFVMSSSPSMFTRVRKDVGRYEGKVKFTKTDDICYIPAKKQRNVYVCMTSYPARIASVAESVKGILGQSIAPDGIFLTLSKDEFPLGPESLPFELRQLSENGFLTIVWTNGNTKTMKKLYPVLDRMEPDDLIVIADDDISFDKDFVKYRLDDFYKFGEAFGISSNDGIEESVGCVVSGAGSLMERKMLDGWKRFVNREVILTFEDDWSYMFVMKMNGYQFVACSKLPKCDYDYKGFPASKCYNTRKTIDVMSRRYAKVMRLTSSGVI